MYYFATFVFLLLAAKGTFLYFINASWFALDFLFIWIGYKKHRFGKKDARLFINFSLFYIAFCVFRSFFLNSLPTSYFVSDIVFLFKYLLTSFLFCALLKDLAVYYLSRVTFHLAKISLVFYALQLVAGNLMWAIGSSINLRPHIVGYDYTNFIVFVYTRAHLYQNCGFSWEPGAYGFFLNMGLLLHLLNNNFKVDKGAMWLIAAIVTTLSTTSYIAMLLIGLIYARAHGVKLVKILTLSAPVLALAAIKLPFLLDKVVRIYNADMKSLKDIKFLVHYYVARHEVFALNRFGSAIFICQLFGIKLIWGLSNIYNESVPALANINISNGIFEFFAKFGVIGMVLLLQRCYVFFKNYAGSRELAVYGLLMILVLGFGESIFLIPLMVNFYFMYFYSMPVQDTAGETLEEEVVDGVLT